MKRLVFWFDVVSPDAWLAFEQLPRTLEGISHSVEYRPLLLGAVLQHWGQKGPAEISAKRDWAYREVRWLAHRQGVPLQLPLRHPFRSLELQRLLVAAGASRRNVELVLRHVWIGGADALDAGRVDELRNALAPQRDPDSDEVKAELRALTGEAIQHGVFGVPSIECDGRVFWGLDALPMLRAAIDGDPWFEHEWERPAGA